MSPLPQKTIERYQLDQSVAATSMWRIAYLNQSVKHNQSADDDARDNLRRAANEIKGFSSVAGVYVGRWSSATDCATSSPSDPSRSALTVIPQLSCSEYVRPPVSVSPVVSPQKIFVAVQKWEGWVVDFDDETFTVQLSDRTNPENPPEQMTLSIEEITEADLPLLDKGAIFYWHIGYEEEFGRGRSRVSRIRFRRLKWTAQELKKAEKEANDLYSFFHRRK